MSHLNIVTQLGGAMIECWLVPMEIECIAKRLPAIHDILVIYFTKAHCSKHAEYSEPI